MKNITLLVLLILVFSTLDATSQTGTIPGKTGVSGIVVLANHPAFTLEKADLRSLDRSEKVISPPGRSESDILKDLYRERYEEPFWKK